MDADLINLTLCKTRIETHYPHLWWAMLVAVVSFIVFLPYSALTQEFPQGVALRNSLVSTTHIETKYRDAVYAQSIWDRLRSRADFDAERRKYADSFDPWFETWQRNPTAAMQEIDPFDPNLPDGFWGRLFVGSKARRQQALQRGFDLQLLFEDFQGRYQKWKHNAKEFIRDDDARVSLRTLDISRFFGPRPCMKPRQESILECGLPPDWRTTDEKIEDGYIMIAVEKSRRKRDVMGKLLNIQNIFMVKTAGMVRDPGLCERDMAARPLSEQERAMCVHVVTSRGEIDALSHAIDILVEEAKSLERDLVGLRKKIGMGEQEGRG